ncbi:acyl-CoA thioesterase [Desulfovibrio inopinatus]|uniref:acyl-CoA thioesterase n=1 Tax=Desulfovibrio inopinatus TaxID=102109 RepID=UPI000417DD39|nr:acyl-CoA thioesterase [Desulfovibrio inopinatus]
MQARPISYSRIVSPQRMMPQDANPAGNVHGGVILRYIDMTASIVAIRHAGKVVVTASIDRMDFLTPSYVGEMCTFMASCNYVGRTSMEIGVRVQSENLISGETRHAGSAYLTFVALDEMKRPTAVPQLILENDQDRRRFAEAQMRREMRLAERKREREGQASMA